MPHSLQTLSCSNIVRLFVPNVRRRGTWHTLQDGHRSSPSLQGAIEQGVSVPVVIYEHLICFCHPASIRSHPRNPLRSVIAPPSARSRSPLAADYNTLRE